jgi:hypothetical protein
VRNNIVYGNWALGIVLYSETREPGGRNVVDGNYVFDNGYGAARLGYNYEAGICIARGHPNTVVTNNRVCGNAHYGILVVDHQGGAVIRGNLTCYNGAGGIYLHVPGTGNVVRQNISYDDNRFALGADGPFESDQNVFYKNGTSPRFQVSEKQISLAEYRKATGQDAKSAVLNPRFSKPPKGRFDPKLASAYEFCTKLNPALCPERKTKRN